MKHMRSSRLTKLPEGGGTDELSGLRFKVSHAAKHVDPGTREHELKLIMYAAEICTVSSEMGKLRDT